MSGRSRSPLRAQPPLSADYDETPDIKENSGGGSKPVIAASEASTLDLHEISVTVTRGDPSSWVQSAVSIFRKYGVVILRDLFTERITNLVWASSRELHEIWGATHDPEKVGNRCPGRYDMGSAYNTQHLTHLPGYLEALEEFAQQGGLKLLKQLGGYKFVGGQGTLVLANTNNWQPMHSDCYQAWHPDLEHEPEHVPCIDLMFTVHPLTYQNGAMRILPGQPSWDKMHRQNEFPPPKLDRESAASKLSQLFPLPAGYGILRDIRIWHGGVPNTSDEDRHIPVLQFYSDRALSLCSIADRGGGVSADAVKLQLSSETQRIVAAQIVRQEHDDMPQLQGKWARWPGMFSY